MTFGELQDILTYFIKYENRHQMKNTLAMINPVSCQVTQVVADNVQLDRSDAESILSEDDFITSHEEERGEKLPVYVGGSTLEVRNDTPIYATLTETKNRMIRPKLEMSDYCINQEMQW
jgi:hypothetical protein